MSEHKIPKKVDFSDLGKLHIANERADVASRYLEFMPRDWVLKNVLGFSNEEICKIDHKRINDEGVAYFKKKMHGALNVPADYLDKHPADYLDKLKVGPNDILVIHVKTTDVPSDMVEMYLKRAKRDLAKLLDKVGLGDRTLWVASDRTSFSVIAQTGTSPSRFGMTGFAGVLNELKPAQRKPKPPVMG